MITYYMALWSYCFFYSHVIHCTKFITSVIIKINKFIYNNQFYKILYLVYALNCLALGTKNLRE